MLYFAVNIRKLKIKDWPRESYSNFYQIYTILCGSSNRGLVIALIRKGAYNAINMSKLTRWSYIYTSRGKRRYFELLYVHIPRIKNIDYFIQTINSIKSNFIWCLSGFPFENCNLKFYNILNILTYSKNRISHK